MDRSQLPGNVRASQFRAGRVVGMAHLWIQAEVTSLTGRADAAGKPAGFIQNGRVLCTWPTYALP